MSCVIQPPSAIPTLPPNTLSWYQKAKQNTGMGQVWPKPCSLPRQAVAKQPRDAGKDAARTHGVSILPSLSLKTAGGALGSVTMAKRKIDVQVSLKLTVFQPFIWQ